METIFGIYLATMVISIPVVLVGGWLLADEFIDNDKA